MRSHRFAPRLVAALALALAFTLAACADGPGEPAAPAGPAGPAPAFAAAEAEGTSWLLMTGRGPLPADLADQVAAAGGTITSAHPAIGVAFASSTDPGFRTRAAGIAGIQTVAADVSVQWVPEERVVDGGDAAGAGVGGDHIGQDESFWGLQWAPTSVHAPEAWDQGARGTGVRVAVLDGGIRSTHIDIAPNLDVAASESFVPGTDFNQDLGTFSHATHVAGIVAAADNGLGTIGIAPGATLIGVKVLHGGSGDFEWVINGIMYAATPLADGGAGADIINMSLSGSFPKQGAELAHLANAVSRATDYAAKQGVVVVGSAGNAAHDMDHDANLVIVPAQSLGVLTVSATGPLLWGKGATNYSRPASYTNYGQSAIDFAGPGGDFAYPGNDNCTVAGLTRPCWVFDMVFSPGSMTSNTGYFWAAGTSMSAPAVAAVAALILEEHPDLTPAQVEAKLKQTSDDLGKPGNDDFYGQGFVNALRAVTE